MKRTAVLFLIAAIALCAAVAAACSRRESSQPLEQVNVQLGWYHQAQWAGYYAADQNGYYKEEGLAVTLLPRPSPKADTIGIVLDGKAHFGSINGIGLIYARSQGRPVAAIASIYRRDPLVFMSLADSGITRPHDFAGRTIAALNPKGSAIVFNSMMARLGLDPDSVEQVARGYDMGPFFSGEVDIWAGFLTDEVLQARERGYEVNVILPGYYGVHLYGMCLFTTEAMIADEPELVLRFLRATLKGWQWSIENFEQAALLAIQYNPKLEKDHETAMMQAGIPLIHTGEDHIGWMKEEVWQLTHAAMLDQDILTDPLDVSQVYTMRFLQQIYGDNR